MDKEVLRRDLEQLAPVIHAKMFRLLGGEPLLHPQITEMLTIAGHSGIADEVGIITNGLLIDRMEEGFWKTLKDAIVNIYPNSPGDLPGKWKAKSQQYGFKLDMPFPVRFTWLLLENDGHRFFDCNTHNGCLTVHEGRFYSCCESLFIPMAFPDRFPEQEGIPIEGITEESLMAYLNTKKPFPSCQYCTGERLGFREWRQADSREEWVRLSTFNPSPAQQR